MSKKKACKIWDATPAKDRVEICRRVNIPKTRCSTRWKNLPEPYKDCITSYLCNR